MSQAPPDLVVENLTRDFPGAAGTLHILTGADLSLARGDAAVITGPSGSGKSTLLYIIGVLDEPTSGRVSIGGTDPFGQPVTLTSSLSEDTIDLGLTWRY